MRDRDFSQCDNWFLYSAVGVVLIHFALMGVSVAVKTEESKKRSCRVEKVVKVLECRDHICSVITDLGFKGESLNPEIGQFSRICTQTD